MTARHIDRAIEALARRQHGAFSRRQARASGASSNLIDRRRQSGAWLQLAPSVYALPGNPPTFLRQCMAAVLGEAAAAVSGPTAAVLHGLDGFRPGRIEITVPSGAAHRSELAVVRRAGSFLTTTVDGVPVGTIEQTLCDLAPRVRPAGLARALDEVLAHRRTTVPRLFRRVDALPPGARRRVRPLIDLLVERDHDAYVPPSSALEAALHRVLADPRLPPSTWQAALPWRPGAPQRVDALLPAWRVIVEADGRAWHTRVVDFVADRSRDREALRHGYRTVRFVYEELVGDPTPVVLELLAIGAAARAA